MPGASDPDAFRFGAFTLDGKRRLLQRDDVTVPLTPKQFDTLEYLVRNAGRILGKEEMLKALWPDSFVEENNLSQHIFWLRKAFQSASTDGAQPDYILTVPGKGYRFVAPVTRVEPAAVALEPPPPAAISASPVSFVSAPSRRSPWAFAVLAIALTGAGILLWRHRGTPEASAAQVKREIVFGEFANTTGDPALTGPLSSVLRIGLGQSPYLTPLSRANIRTTLAAMTLSPEAPLTPELAVQVCLRHHSSAVIAGAIAPVGSTYVVTLEASDCMTGRAISSGKALAKKKEEIVNALDSLLPDLRRRLGESSPSVQQFSIPVEQTTTPSLEAFEAFAAGDEHLLHGSFADAIPFYEKAVAIDPKFAMAYSRLGVGSVSLGEADKAAMYFTKAYQLRENLSPREKLYIEAAYVGRVTADLDESIRVSERDRALYPLDRAPWTGEVDALTQVGRFNEAIRIGEEGLRRYPDDAILHIALGRAYLRAGNLDGLKRVGDDAANRQFEGWDLHELLWNRDVLLGDATAAAAERTWVVGRPEEYQALDDDAFLNLTRGRAAAAQASQREFVVVARRESMHQYADEDVGNFAFVLEEVGLHREAAALIHTWHASAASPQIARGLAEVGDAAAVQALAANIHDGHPQDTLINAWTLPGARAAVLLHRSDEASARLAIEALQPAEALGMRDFYAPYLRGKAYRQAGQWDKAEAEFQRILDTPGGDPFSPLYPLPLLHLARTQAQAGKADAARHSYTKLLQLWQQADPTLPVLVQARSELDALK